MITRREWIRSGVCAAGGVILAGRLVAADASFARTESFRAQMEDLEKTSGGRLGVAYLDTAHGTRAGYREDERFPMCSTFKVLAAGKILLRVDHGREHLDRMVHYTQKEIVSYSPFTATRVGNGGASLREICVAALTLSDNTAANLMLASIGGPAAVTAFARSLGDKVTRLDRTEPALNEALPGDPRDTTSPAAMVADLQRLLLGQGLSPGAKTQLAEWMKQCKTGGERLRAGVPADWMVGDKTGSGDRGTANDIAILWPPHASPVMVAVYLTQAKAGPAQRNETIAAVGGAIAALHESLTPDAFGSR